jgi:8-oxo-dGTP diphosphatase
MTIENYTNKSIRPAARAVMLFDKEIVLLKDLSLLEPNYALPGGGIEFGESAREALRRELIEEIGIDLSIGRFLGCFEQSFEHHRLGLLHDLTLCFLVILSAEEKAQVISQEEGYQVCWITINDLATLNLVPPQLPELLLEWIEHDMNRAFKSSFNGDG